MKLTNPYFEPAEDMGMFMEMLNALTWELIMDKFSKTGVIPPPEQPELSATRGVVPSPHTKHISR